MKKLRYALIAVFAAALLGLAFTACQTGPEPAPEDYLVYNEQISYRFSLADAADCPGGKVEDGDLHQNVDLVRDAIYYLVLDCHITGYDWTRTAGNFDIIVEIYSLDGLTATLQEADSGYSSEENDNNTRVITVTYRVPEDNAQRDIRIIYKVQMTGGSVLGADVSFDGQKFSDKFVAGIEYSYTHTSEGYIINGIKEGGEGITDLTIPQYYQEESVVGIADGAFTSADVEKVTVPEGIASIGSNAFYGCVSLKEISLPESLLSIGDAAFGCCVSLQEIDLPSQLGEISQKLFVDCARLTHVQIPSNVGRICDEAFSGCGMLVSAEVPQSVIHMGFNSFGGCNGLKAIELPFVGSDLRTSTRVLGWIFGAWYAYENKQAVPPSLRTVKITSDTSVPEGAFADCDGLTEITLPQELTKIGSKAFSGCSSLLSISIPAGVEDLGEDAFYGCTGLTSIQVDPDNRVFSAEGNCLICDQQVILGCATSQIPSSGVAIIDANAFYGCTNLTSIDIPEGITVIRDSAFYGTGLLSVHLPASCTIVAGRAFSGCNALEEITVDAANPQYYAERDCLMEQQDKVVVIGCKNSIIPNNASAIAGYAFYNCSTLTQITIPARVTSIGESAFEGCGISSVTIPERVVYIGRNAFKSCQNLSSVQFELTDGWEAGGEEVDDKIKNSTTSAACLRREYADREWRHDLGD